MKQRSWDSTRMQTNFGKLAHMCVLSTGLVINKDTLFTEEICKDRPHVMVAMLGHFKGETGVDQHLISLASKSVSGLKTQWWIDKLATV